MLVILLAPVPSAVAAQDTSVLCRELGECQQYWLSELGYAYRFAAPITGAHHNFTWEFGLLQPMGDRRTVLGGTTYVGVDLSGNTRVGVKVRQLTQLRRFALDIGLGALLFDSRGGIGATAHVGVNVKRHFGLRLSADVVDRPGGSLAVAYIGGSVAKLSSRLSPIEGLVGAVLPVIMILVNII